MKKHDEGYVLVYVMVVLVVFCLVAATILTGALRNLNHQQSQIDKMQDQYEAAGWIEQVLAQWGNSSTESGQYVTINNVPTNVACTEKGMWEDTQIETVTLYAQSGTVSITCVVQAEDGKVLSYRVGTVELPAASTPPSGGGDSQ